MPADWTSCIAGATTPTPSPPAAAAPGGRRGTRPGRRFRQGSAYLTVGPSWNYDGDAIQRAVGTFGYAQLRNFWSLDWSATSSAAVTDDRLTRGGPLAAKPAGWQASGDVYTDDRKRVSEYGFASYASDAAGGWSPKLIPQLTIPPSPTASLRFTPGYFTGRAAAQYVSRVPDATAAATLRVRYVFAELRQQSFYVTWRLNATFSPVLSFQLYAQPFTFTGHYTGFKELRAPRTFSFNRYGQDNGSSVTTDHPPACGGPAPRPCPGH